MLFEEIQVIGTKKIIRVTEAKLLPERNFVHDLVYDYHTMADEITGTEFDAIKSEIKG